MKSKCYFCDKETQGYFNDTPICRPCLTEENQQFLLDKAKKRHKVSQEMVEAIEETVAVAKGKRGRPKKVMTDIMEKKTERILSVKRGGGVRKKRRKKKS